MASQTTVDGDSRDKRNFPSSSEPPHMNTSSTETLLALCNSDVDVLALAKNWHEACSSWKEKERKFIELLFHSAGWSAFTYESFMSSSFRLNNTDVTGAAPVETYALDETFLQKFDQFIQCVYDFDFLSTLRSGFTFFKSIERAVKELNFSGWEHCRIVAAYAGLKLITSINLADASVRSKRIHRAESTSETKIIKKRLAHLKQNLWDFVGRTVSDVSSAVRLLAFTEMVFWAKQDPIFMLDKKLHQFIKFGLCDIPFGSECMLQVVNILFERDLKHVQQQILMDKIAEMLVYHAQTNRTPAQIAVKVMSSAVRYLKIRLPREALSVIFVCVYNPDLQVAKKAAEFVYYSLPKRQRESPKNLLESLVNFYDECEIKSCERLIDAFSDFLKTVDWEHWMELLLTCEPELIPQASYLFVGYVKKMTTYAGSPGKPKRNRSAIDKQEVGSAATRFTRFIAKNWGKLLTNKRIRLLSNATSTIAAAIAFVDNTLPPLEALDMIDCISDILEKSNDPGLIRQCILTLAHLQHIVVWTSAEQADVDSRFDEIKKVIINDFTEYINSPSSFPKTAVMEARMINLIQYLPLSDDNDIWHTCLSVLSSFRSFERDSQLIAILIKVLLAIFMQTYTSVLNGTPDSSSPDTGSSDSLTPCAAALVLSRLDELQPLIVVILNSNLEFQIRVTAYNVLAEFVKPFGRHLAASVNDPSTVFFHNHVLPVVEPLIIKFAYETMLSATRPNRNSFPSQRILVGATMGKICHLFKWAYIDFMKISDFIALAGQNSDVDVIIFGALKFFLEHCPEKYKTVAVVIFKGIMLICMKSLIRLDETTLCASINFVRDTKSVIDKWLLYDDFCYVWRNSNVVDSVKFMMDRFGRSTGCLKVCELSSSFCVVPPPVQNTKTQSSDSDLSSAEQETSIDYTQFATSLQIQGECTRILKHNDFPPRFKQIVSELVQQILSSSCHNDYLD